MTGRNNILYTLLNGTIAGTGRATFGIPAIQLNITILLLLLLLLAKVGNARLGESD